MFSQLPPPQALIAPAAHQRGFNQAASLDHSIPAQTTQSVFALLFRLKKREDGRSAPAHSHPGVELPQPCRDFAKLGELLENNGFEIVRAKRTGRRRASLTLQSPHKG